MHKTYKLKKGFDIKLEGEASAFVYDAPLPKTVAVRPPNFKGVIPKLLVDVGSEVKAGTPLFYSKDNDKVLFTSPVSGEVVEINRGAKRAILEVKILADSSIKYESFKKGNPADMTREEVIENLQKSGVWPVIRQRPFDKIADQEDTPKAIYISGFDSSPLAPQIGMMLKDHGDLLQTAIDALTKLTDGPVNINLKVDRPTNSTFEHLKGVYVHYFDGPHPAGNVGVQIHHIDPINKGDVVWVVNPMDLLTIGRLFTEGKYNAETVIALCGQSVKDRKYVRTVKGACIEDYFKNNVEEGNLRYISGNVLTGENIGANGYLGFYHNQVTVIPEGTEPEMFGWLLPSYPRPSISATFPAVLFPDKKYKVNTNMHGEERAYVVTGEYEKVVPMDIMPVFLIKAILAGDLEAMEHLGLLEVVEEDLALCEFICTSKMDVQEIVREGLDLMEKEG